MQTKPVDDSYQLHLDGLAPWPKLDPILVRLEERFDKIRAKLAAEHEGRYALLLYRGPRLVPELKIFDDQHEAIDAGFLDPERRRFCVKQIREFDMVIDLRHKYQIAGLKECHDAIDAYLASGEIEA